MDVRYEKFLQVEKQNCFIIIKEKKMKEITLLAISLIIFTSVQVSAQWEKVYGTYINNTIVHDIIIHQGSYFAGTN